ncbi:MAG TPA: T9SS type A sorting domain-containing protein [Bacteroidia bacterium]|jgi:hypothetical protein|nr:T9SS type A sorting domain-containing protein [Bacteroidia bacterium]
MRSLKKTGIVLIILVIKMSVLQAQYLYDFAVDTANHKVFVAGSFYTYKGQPRQHLAAIDSRTGKLLNWHPVFPSYVVTGIALDNNTVYVAGETRNDGFIYAIDTSGNVVSSLKTNISSISYISNLTINNGLLFLSGGFQMPNGDTKHTIVLDKQGNLIPTSQEFSDVAPTRMIFTSDKIWTLQDMYLSVFDKSSLILRKSVYLSAIREDHAVDFTVYNDTAFVVGNFDSNGGIKYDAKNDQILEWGIPVNDGNCNTTDEINSPACATNNPYSRMVTAIALRGNRFYIGGKINKKRANGTCSPLENPLIVTSTTTPQTAEFSGAKLFDTDTNKRVKKYNIIGDVLYYITSAEACIGTNASQYIRTDKIAAYCLMPGNVDFINPNSFPCSNTEIAYEVNAIEPNLKYVWSSTVPGAVIKPNGNKAIITFPYNKLESSVDVKIINDCGMTVNASTPIIITRSPNASIATSQVNLLTCSQKSLTFTGGSSESGSNFLWTYPDGSTSTTKNITISQPGTYQLQVSSNVTGCVGKTSITTQLDTITPKIKNGLAYTITSCNPYEVKVTGLSDTVTDKIVWYDNGIQKSNPVVFVNTGSYIEEVTRERNGCVTKAIVKVTSNTPQPTIIPPSTATKDANGNVIVDTLTCVKSNVLMNFTSNVANYKIDIKRPSPFNDTVANNSTVTSAGFYTIHIQDLTSLCKGNPMLVEIKSDKRLPQIEVPSTVPSLNCSYSEVKLEGKSATPGVQLVWTGAGNFSSSNPATVNQPGEYILTVTDGTNGCTKKDTVNVIKQNILALNGQKDTLICIGSEIELTTKPVGGTPSFTYSWSSVAGNNASIKVKPVNTTTYSVTVIDAANCVGKDTIVVKVPAAIRDSTITYAPCDPASVNGQIQVFASGGIPPYSYSKDNGLTYQSSQIFANLAFGNYKLSVKDSLGCTHAFSKSITAQSQKPTSDFIINTTMMAKDTFVVVDISNPRPDTIIWKFPASVKVINTNFYAPIIVSADTGEVEVVMGTHFGTCVNNLTKKIKFIKKDTTISPTKGNGIEELNIFPNPNTGEFTVEVKLFKKQRLAIYVFDAKGVEQIRVVEPVVDYSSNNIVLPLKTPGTYVLKVIAEFDSKAKAIVVTQ